MGAQVAGANTPQLNGTYGTMDPMSMDSEIRPPAEEQEVRSGGNTERAGRATGEPVAGNLRTAAGRVMANVAAKVQGMIPPAKVATATSFLGQEEVRSAGTVGTGYVTAGSASIEDQPVEVEQHVDEARPASGSELFSPQQARRLREMEQEAPLLYSERFPVNLRRLRQMDGMQLRTGSSSASSSAGPEVVRPGVQELVKLPPPTLEGASGFSDWIHAVKPSMSDLSDTSGECWRVVLEEAREWYNDKFVPATPIARVRLRVPESSTDREPKWARVRHRMEHLIIQACSDSVRAELSSARVSGVLNILCKLHVIYKPGGVAERSEALKQVQHPRPADSPIDAVLKLRMWKRWMTRLTDLGGAPPDAALSIQALESITGSVLRSLPSLSFRINLVRASLHLDTQPTGTKVNEYFEHLLVELEAVSRVTESPSLSPPGAKSEANKNVRQVDARTAGGNEASPAAPKEARCRNKTGLTGAGQAKRDDGASSAKSARTDPTQKPKGSDPGLRKVLSDAAGVLREAIHASASTSDSAAHQPPSAGGSARGGGSDAGTGAEGPAMAAAAAKIQAQLEDLEARVLDGRGPTVRAVSSVVEAGSFEQTALLDSGATHAVLDVASAEGQDLVPCTVSLAGDQRQTWKQTPGGSLVAPSTGEGTTQTILPLGCLVDQLDCSVRWSRKGGMHLTHPRLGRLKTSLKGGCPQLNREQAMTLIKELESAKLGELTGRLKKVQAYLKGMQGLSLTDAIDAFVGSGDYGASLDLLQLMPFLCMCKDRQVELVELGVTRERYRCRRTYENVECSEGISSALQAKIDDDVLTVLQPMWLWTVASLSRGEGVPTCQTHAVYPDGANECWMRDVVDPFQQWSNCSELFIDSGLGVEGTTRPMKVCTNLGLTSGVKQVPQADVALEGGPVAHGWPQVFRREVSMALFGGSLVAGHVGQKVPAVNAVGAEQPSSSPEAWLAQERQVSSGEHQQAQAEDAQHASRELSDKEKEKWRRHIAAHHIPFRLDCLQCVMSGSLGLQHRRVKCPSMYSLAFDLTGPFVERGKDDRGGCYKYALVAGLRVPDIALPAVDPKAEVGANRSAKVPKAKSKSKVGQYEPPVVEDDAPSEASWLQADLEPKDPLEPTAQEEPDDDDEKESVLSWFEAPDLESLKASLEDLDDCQEAAEDEPVGDGAEQKASDGDPWVDDQGVSSLTDEQFDEELAQLLFTGANKVLRFVVPLKSRKGPQILSGADVKSCDGLVAIKVDTALVHARCLEELVDPEAELGGNYPIHVDRRRAGLNVRYARMSGQEWAELCQLDEEQFEARFERWQRVLGGTDEDPFLHPASAAIPHALLVATVFQQRDWGRDPAVFVEGPRGPVLAARVMDFSDDGPAEEGPFPDRMLMFSVHDVIRDIHETVILRVVLVEEESEGAGQAPQILQPPGPPAPEVRAVTAMEEQLRSEGPRPMRLPVPLPNPTSIKTVGNMLREHASVDEGPQVCKTEAATTKDLEQLLEGLTEPLSVTHTASQEEVRANLQKWKPAIEKELQSLKKQGVLVSHFGSEARAMTSDPETSVISLKGVFTAKAPGDPSEGLFKRKCRLVGCGNQATHVDADSLYAAGAPAKLVRAALTQAAHHEWAAFTTDIKAAFTNTPIPSHAARRYMLRPPRWLVELGLASPGEYYSLGMVLYGFKEAPAWWSDHRDSKLAKAKFAGCHLEQGKSDASIWRIKEGEVLKGYLVTYVDDFLILSDRVTAKELHGWLISGAGWETDGLSEAKPGSPVRFLGMQLQGHEDGHFSLDQEAYVDELVRAYGLTETCKSKTVCPKELLMTEEVDVQAYDEPTIRLAQKLAGECLWLAQRTRLDISFATTVLCSKVSRDPHTAIAIGKRILSYLFFTKDYKLHLRPDPRAPALRVFTDASFSPQGQHSYGGHVVEVSGVPVLWKASKQSLIALSSSEAELIQAVEGCVYAESLITVLRDLGVRCESAELMLDNTASISFIGGAGNQRTRHLKVRGFKIRQLVQSGWTVTHCRGEIQKADLMTKMLSAGRTRFLCDLLQLGADSAVQEPEPQDGTAAIRALSSVPTACFQGLLLLLHASKCAGAPDDGSEVGVPIEWPWELGIARRAGEEPMVRAVSAHKKDRGEHVEEVLALCFDPF
ncbi:Copia protein [Symbiodinium microadriaticum]|uniref:Copia protein n=1 Tax=Symbiodinium microadriaticum TaxID=2951 RepID=A0A1Q9CXL8_SYMMI|nr:Copia protein [Symbiodinium microadriaticum]